MARPIYQYRPVTDTPDTAIGISLPFNSDGYSRPVDLLYNTGSLGKGSVFNSTYSTLDQAVSNLVNLLLTEKGERFMQPNFGTNLRSILFQNNTEDLRSSILASVRADINTWLPYIEIQDLILSTDIDRHIIRFQLVVTVNPIGAELVINLFLNENELTLGVIDNLSPEQEFVQIN